MEKIRAIIPAAGKGKRLQAISGDLPKAMFCVNGKPMLAPGEEGINGLTISNAIHLSGWTGEIVNVKNFPHERFYELLQEKIRTSTIVKKESQVVVDISNTH